MERGAGGEAAHTPGRVYSSPSPSDGEGVRGVRSPALVWTTPVSAFFLTLFLLVSSTALAAESSVPTVLLVIGAPGEPEFGSNFLRQATLWQKVCSEANCRQLTIGLDSAKTNDYDQMKESLAAEPKDGLAPLWLILVGHGSFDGKEARFNLRGPDVSATELAQWVQPFRRPLAIIDTSSSSACSVANLPSAL